MNCRALHCGHPEWQHPVGRLCEARDCTCTRFTTPQEAKDAAVKDEGRKTPEFSEPFPEPLNSALQRISRAVMRGELTVHPSLPEIRAGKLFDALEVVTQIVRDY